MAPKQCSRDEAMPWLWSCEQQQQQQWTLSLFRSCRPRVSPPRVLVPFYTVTASHDIHHNHHQQQHQQQQHRKLFTVHSFDLHISPPLHLKDLWQTLGVHLPLLNHSFCVLNPEALLGCHDNFKFKQLAAVAFGIIHIFKYSMDSRDSRCLQSCQYMCPR
jgi:hypothetical protein